MNFLKRAYLHTARKKGKSLAMFIILLTISTLILTCLAIQSATDTSVLNIRKSFMGSFTINAQASQQQLDNLIVDDIVHIPGMTQNYNLRSYYSAEYRDENGKELEIITDGASEVPTGYEHAGKIVSSSQLEMDTYFTEAGFELTQGRHIEPDDEKAVVINAEFAKLNILAVGDNIILASIDSDAAIIVEIVGIYEATVLQDSLGMAPSYELYGNIMFSDHQTYSLLKYDDGLTHYQCGDFYVDDPAQLDTIISNIIGIDGVAWDSCVITKNDTDYQNAKSSLESLQSLVTIIIFVLLVISVALLTLILLLWIRNRVHEIGVLLGMGFSKASIVAQHTAEILLIAFFAFALSFGTSSAIAQDVGNSLFQQSTAEKQVTVNNLTEGTSEAAYSLVSLKTLEVTVSFDDLLLVYIIGFSIICLSILIASCPIMRIKPKEILSKMS